MNRIASAEIGTSIIEIKGVTKIFPGVVANDRINFELRKGEIHCLLGENGAGKTVLMSILYGLYRADAGEIYVGGQGVDIRSPKDAIDLGIGMVHQQFALVDAFSVSENIVLGLRSSREPLLDIEQSEQRVKELSARYGLVVNPKSRVKDLSVGERQRVEVLKILYRNAVVLILDEPTTMLTPQEMETLFKILRSMVDQGLSIVFITHKIPEVMAVSDRVTVLRNGKVVATVDTAGTSEKELATLMVGRETFLRIPKSPLKRGNVVLRLENLWVRGEENTHAVKDVSFSVSQGEILGIAGVAGNGQKELVESLVGLRRVEKGKVILNGTDATNFPTRKVFEQSVAWIPDDRRRGVIDDFSIEENFILKDYYGPQFSSRWVIKPEAVREFAGKLVTEYEVKTPGTSVPAAQLSGGNIQRMIVARELCRTSRLMIAENPTQGLDIKLTEFVRRKLIEQRDSGTAVLLVSVDLDEILGLSDRITVMYRGEIVGIIDAAEAQVAKLGLMMAGSRV